MSKEELTMEKLQELVGKKANLKVFADPWLLVQFNNAYVVALHENTLFFVTEYGSARTCSVNKINEITEVAKIDEVSIFDCNAEVVSTLNKETKEKMEKELVSLGAALSGKSRGDISIVFICVEGFVGELSVVVNKDVFGLINSGLDSEAVKDSEYKYDMNQLSVYCPTLYESILKLSLKQSISGLQYEKDLRELYLAGDKKQ